MNLLPTIRRGWLAALWAGPAILLFALLPSLTYLGHWETVISYSFNDNVRPLAEAPVTAAGVRAQREGQGTLGHHHGTRVDTGPAEPREDEQQPPDHTHAAHCHTNVSSCSDQSAPWDLRALEVVVEVGSPSFVEYAQVEMHAAGLAFVTAIPTEPPRMGLKARNT